MPDKETEKPEEIKTQSTRLSRQTKKKQEPTTPYIVTTKPRQAPRKLSFTLKAFNMLGGKTSKIGWIILTVGILITGVLLPFVDYQSAVISIKPTELTVADLTDVKKTFWSLGETTLTQYSYSFKDKQDKTYTGKSYSAKENLPKLPKMAIKYVVKNPKISVIEGMRPAVFPLPMIIFPALLLLAGLLLILFKYQKGRAVNKLLKYGQITWGKVSSKEETKEKINGKPVYKLTIEYTDVDKKPNKIIFSTHRVDKLSSEQTEPVFYDSLKHQKPITPLQFAGDIIVTDFGDFTCENPKSKLLILLFPLSSIVALGGVLFFYFKYLT